MTQWFRLGFLYNISIIKNSLLDSLNRKGNKSFEQGLNLSGSWQQGHSAAYNTPFELSRLQRIYPDDEWNFNSWVLIPACD